MTKVERLRAEVGRWPKSWRANMLDPDGDPVDVESGDEFAWSGDWTGDGDGGEDPTFGPADDCGPQLGKFVADIVDAAPALLDLWQARELERDAVCVRYIPYDNECRDDNHIARCPIAVARAAVAAVLAKGLP